MKCNYFFLVLLKYLLDNYKHYDISFLNNLHLKSLLHKNSEGAITFQNSVKNWTRMLQLWCDHLHVQKE